MESQSKPQAKEFKKIFNPHTKINNKFQGKKEILRAINNPSSNQNVENQKQVVKKFIFFKFYLNITDISNNFQKLTIFI